MKQWLVVLMAVWFLWGQDEKSWPYWLLNVIPGPTRGQPYIVAEYENQSDCVVAHMKQMSAQSRSWNLPEVRQDFKKFGRPRSVTWYACVPSTFKPEWVDAGGVWR